MIEKEVFYPAEEYYKKQNNCEFYLVKTDYKLLMIDDIVRILNNQRETIQYHRKTEKQLEKEHTRLTNQLRLSYDKINKLTDENEELKKEVEMLRNGLKAYDEALPLYLDCEEIMHFNSSELFEFQMEQMDFYKKYPNRVHYK